MNPITVLFDVPGFTQKNYDDCIEELMSSGGMPVNEGLISHVSFQKGSNWCVVDVWKSQEAFMAYGQQRLFPIFEKLQVTPPQPQIFPAHSYVSNAAEEMMVH